MRKLLIIITLGVNIYLSCNPNKQQKEMLILSVIQNDTIIRIKDFTICCDTNKLNVAVRIGISNKIKSKIPKNKINKIVINYGYDTLVFAKGLDYLLCNPPNTNSFFLTEKKETNLYGKTKDSLFWFYLFHNVGKKNELLNLKRFIK